MYIYLSVYLTVEILQIFSRKKSRKNNISLILSIHEKSKNAEATMTFPNEIAKDILAFYFPSSYTLATSRLDRLVFTTISISKQWAKNPSQLFCPIAVLGAILLWFCSNGKNCMMKQCFFFVREVHAKYERM